MCACSRLPRHCLLLPTRPRQAGHGLADDCLSRPLALPYRISAVRFMADEEVFAKIRLIPISHGDPTVDVGAAATEGRAEDDRPKPASFAKMSRYRVEETGRDAGGAC
ncbi:hypothetical protein ZWY2020_022005 [Hordeum vulgare]|nr:hypothetical protein ZWY2020_022005 [Hordeum vulgare]